MYLYRTLRHFLCGRWNRQVNPTREATEGIWLLCRPLRPGRNPDEYVEDGKHGMPDTPHAWQHVGSGVWDTGDGDGSNLSVAAEDAGPMPKVRSGGHGGVTADAPSESALCGTVLTGAGYHPHPPPGRPEPIGSPLHKFCHYSCDRKRGVWGTATNWTNLRVKILHRRMHDTIVILEERNRPYPRFHRCEIILLQ